MKAVFTGTVVEVFRTEVFGVNATQKRKIRVDISANGYTSIVDFSLLHDKVEIGDKLSKGDNVEVTCSVVGRLYEGTDGETKNYIELNAYRVAFMAKTVL